MKSNRRARRRIGAWIGALVLPVCLLAAAPVTGQASPLRFDPDDTKERFQSLPVQLERGEFEGSARAMVAERSGRVTQLSLSRLTVRPGFFRGHLLPRMSYQLGSVASIYALETQRGRFERSGMHDWVSDTVEHRARRAVQKAAKTYLHEETALGSWVESLRVGRNGFGRSAEGRATDFGIRVSHGIPRVGMRHRSALGTTRIGLGVDGSVRLEFRPTHSISARFYAGYEADVSQYRLSYRLAF